MFRSRLAKVATGLMHLKGGTGLKSGTQPSPSFKLAKDEIEGIPSILIRGKKVSAVTRSRIV